jgi:hypothetical protein
MKYLFCLSVLGVLAVGDIFSPPLVMDVPAAHAPAESVLVSTSRCDNSLCMDGPLECSNHGQLISMYIGQSATCKDGWTWTCADKSRILLTSEDGKKHCVKFNP